MMERPTNPHRLTDDQIRDMLEFLPLLDDVDLLDVEPISAGEFQEIRSGGALDETGVCNQDALDEFQGLGGSITPPIGISHEWRRERAWYGGPPLEDLEPGMQS